MNTFHQIRSYTKISSKKLKVPQTPLNLILCTPSLIATHIFFLFFFTFLFFFLSLFFFHHFLDLGVQTFLSPPIFPFSQCTYIYTPLETVLILTTNEMSIISRFRQFMVFRAVRVKSNVGFKKKFHMVFLYKAQKGCKWDINYQGQLERLNRI